MENYPRSQFANYETVFIPSPVKNRTSYNFNRCFCLTKNTFTNVFDLETLIINQNPDLLHIHLEGAFDGLPWRELLFNLRRKIPHMLVSIWDQGITIDQRILDLYFYVDHVFIGNQTTINQYWGQHLLKAYFWAPNSSISYSEVLTLVKNTRKSFLQNSHGEIDLSVFVGTFNRLEKLRLAINSIISSSNKYKTEIIIHDAGSTDGTQEWLRSLNNENIFIIYAGKRTSFTQAFNETLQIAKGKYICWFSDDIVAEGDALNNMCGIMDTLSATDMAGFYIMNSTGDFREQIVYEARSSEGFYWPTVGYMYTETLRKMNGLNIDYPFYSQDTDLDMRVLRAGGNIIMVPHCKLFHHCRSDELRQSNLIKHENVMGDVKYRLAGWRPNQVSHFLYPTILFIPTSNCRLEDITKTVHNVKKQYFNSHMFLKANDNSLDTNSIKFLKRVPADFQQSFDVIIEVGAKNRLIHPFEFANEIFVKIMLG